MRRYLIILFISVASLTTFCGTTAPVFAQDEPATIGTTLRTNDGVTSSQVTMDWQSFYGWLLQVVADRELDGGNRDGLHQRDGARPDLMRPSQPTLVHNNIDTTLKPRTLPRFAIEAYSGAITPRQEIFVYKPELLPAAYRESPLLVSANFPEAIRVGEEGFRTAVLAVYRDGAIEVIDKTDVGFKMDFRPHRDGRYSVAVPLSEESAACPEDTGANIGNKRLIYRADGQIDAIVSAPNLCHANWHEFLILPNGNYVMPGYPAFYEEELPNGQTFPFEADFMRASAFQEFTPAGDVVFTWNSLRDIPLSDVPSHVISGDYAHINSIDFDAIRNEYAVTLFNTSQLLFIDRATGELNGIFGGVRNEYTIQNDPLHGPCGLHSLVILPDTDDGLKRYMMFDNGRLQFCAPDVVQPHRSRALIYAIDHTSKIATLEWEYSDPAGAYADFSGAIRPSGQGTYIIAWGADADGRLDNQPSISEVLPDGQVVYESSLWFDYPETGIGGRVTQRSARPFIYRAYSLWSE